MTEATSSTTAPTQDLEITRVFAAPRELVFKAFTEPERLMRWWGPRPFTSPAARIDLRVGGRYHFCMRSPDGQDFWSTGVYREIVPPERLVYTDSFADEHGNVVPASHYGIPGDHPLEMLASLTFEALPNGRTLLTLRQTGVPGNAQAVEGWNSSFDKLAEALAAEVAA